MYQSITFRFTKRFQAYNKVKVLLWVICKWVSLCSWRLRVFCCTDVHFCSRRSDQLVSLLSHFNLLPLYSEKCYETKHLRYYDSGETWGRIHLRNVEQCTCVSGDIQCERVRYTSKIQPCLVLVGVLSETLEWDDLPQTIKLKLQPKSAADMVDLWY